MTGLLQGKRGGLLAFLVVATLVAGGLGWVTALALRLEAEQRQGRAEAARAARMRLALWRLDTRVYTDFAQEANRPFNEYRSLETSTLPARPGIPVTVVELSVDPKVGNNSWMLRNFLVASPTDWHTPQALRETLSRQLRVGVARPSKQQPTAGTLPESLNNTAAVTLLLDQARLQEQSYNSINPAGTIEMPPVLNPENGLPVQVANNRMYGPAQQAQQLDRDTQLRMNRAQYEKGAQFSARGGKNTDVVPAPGEAVVAVLGPLIPLWVPSGDGQQLVVVRLLRLGARVACLVTLLDWPALESQLREEVHEFFPDAHFLPVEDGETLLPDRALTALPVELDPGPLEPEPSPGWTAMRIGLASAWAAALLALVTVGLGGWSLLDLSERRIRFVSAVTHELRTPLTTLRLYLDMLTGGMVTDEGRRAEYLHTLHAEADRLHRLIANVLDFSRLENRRPRTEHAEVSVAALLEQVRETWEGTCASAGKELIVENALPPEATLVTDAQVVQQVVGNLIDNACKYSRSAEDHRLWVRVRQETPETLRLEVEDRGPGVSPREGRAIFRPFRRGRGADVTAGGVGLGLALAARWARVLGGRLTLCRPSETGACFCLELPVGGVGTPRH